MEGPFEANWHEVEQHIRRKTSRQVKREDMKRRAAIASTNAKLAQRMHGMPCRTIRHRIRGITTLRAKRRSNLHAARVHIVAAASLRVYGMLLSP